MWLVVRAVVTGLLVASSSGVWAAAESDVVPGTSHEEGVSDAWQDQEATDSHKRYLSVNAPRQQGGSSQWLPPPWARPADSRPNQPWHTHPRNTPPPPTRRPPKYSLRLSPFQGTYPFESEVRGDSYHSRIRFHPFGGNPKLNHPSRGQTFGNWGFSQLSQDGHDFHSYQHGSQDASTFFDNSHETDTSFFSSHETLDLPDATGIAPLHPSGTHDEHRLRETTLETLPYPDDYQDTFPPTRVSQATQTHRDNHENVQIPQKLPGPLHHSHDNPGFESLETNERPPHHQDSSTPPKTFLQPGNLAALLEGGSQLEENKDEVGTSLDYLSVEQVTDGRPSDEVLAGTAHHQPGSGSFHHTLDEPVPTPPREDWESEDEAGAPSPVWSIDGEALTPLDGFHDSAHPSVDHTSPGEQTEAARQPGSPKAPEDLTNVGPKDFNSDYYDNLYDEFLDMYYDDPEQQQQQQHQRKQQQHFQEQQQENHHQHQHQQKHQQQETTGPNFPPTLAALQPPAGGVPTVTASPPSASLSFTTPSSTPQLFTTTVPSTIDIITAPTSSPSPGTNTNTPPATPYTTTSSTSPSDDKSATAETPATTTSTASTTSTPPSTTTTTPPTAASTTPPPQTTTTSTTTASSTTTTVTTTTTPHHTTAGTTTVTTAGPTPEGDTKPQGRPRGTAISLSEILQGLSLGLPQFLVALKTHGLTLKDFTSRVKDKGLTQAQFRKAKGNLETLVSFLQEGEGEEEEEEEGEEEEEAQSGEEQKQGKKVPTVPYWLTSRPTWRPPTTTTTTTTTTPATTTTTTATTTTTTAGPSLPPKIFGFRPGGRPQFSVGRRESDESVSGESSKEGGEGERRGKEEGQQEDEGREEGDGAKEGAPIPIKLDIATVMREKGLTASDILHDLGSLFTVAGGDNHDDDDDDSDDTAGSGKNTTTSGIVTPDEGDSNSTSTPTTNSSTSATTSIPNPASASPASPVSLKPYIPPRKPQRFRPRPYIPPGLHDGGAPRHIIRNRHQTTVRSTLRPPYQPPSTTPYTPTAPTHQDGTTSDPKGNSFPKYNKKDFNRHAYDDYHHDQPNPNITLNMTKSAIMAASVMGGAAMCVFLAILVVVMYRGRVRLRRTPLTLASDSSTSSTPPLYVPRMRASMGKGPRQTAGFWGTLKKRFDPYSHTSSLGVMS